jgi:hypothetical protein
MAEKPLIMSYIQMKHVGLNKKIIRKLDGSFLDCCTM